MNAALVLFAHETRAQESALRRAALSAGFPAPELWRVGGGAGGSATVLLEAEGALLPSDYTDALAACFAARNPALVLFCGDRAGSAAAALLACRVRAGAAAQIGSIAPDGAGFAVTRRTHGMLLVSKLRFASRPCVFSLAADAYMQGADSVLPAGGASAPERMRFSAASQCVSFNVAPREKTRALADEPLVLVGGRGLGSAENAEKLKRLAARLGAGVGATRPAVYSGWFGLDALVGASGARLSAECCVLFGVSGCMPLLLGIEKCGRVVAVNTDAQAAVFAHCDTGIVAESGALLDAMLEDPSFTHENLHF